ncbi:peptidoglycan/xylan/chitin deacetylase (PgdA/CDA1 family) [Parvibaculum indicum]|uniref:polysaccharide deacetylase family protein n=1 Tax=Parvibaculum indicum TaxID=562969 RepID=UPI001423AE31|nr:polysaccharide deacetylase family protein [Parvibaculum indicum]NIJ39865.1 peptidoglycan/xylan/chitin deacetylase (PgdA/CDA1 family) [Parvibaculum indicum]
MADTDAGVAAPVARGPAPEPSLMRTGLLAIHALRGHRMAPRFLSGLGVIFMLHRVRPESTAPFQPNRLLEITPDFLDETIRLVKRLGYDCVDLDEAARRIETGHERKFAAFTLDDGYRDNFTEALPVFERHETPFTVYLATDLPDGKADLWWITLENVIGTARQITMELEGKPVVIPTATTDDKKAAWQTIYWSLRKRPESEMRAVIAALAEQHNVPVASIAKDAAMSWDELRSLARHPLARIEAHTAGHFALSGLTDAAARAEVERGLARHEAELGKRPTHFSYPYGDHGSAGERDFRLIAEMGFRTATTTRKGLIQPRHRDRMCALPRLSLNGEFQDIRMVETLLSGLPFALGKPIASMGID